MIELVWAFLLGAICYALGALHGYILGVRETIDDFFEGLK